MVPQYVVFRQEFYLHTALLFTGVLASRGRSAVRLTAGVFNPALNIPPNNLLSDWVNVNDTPQFERFPYVWFSGSRCAT